MSGECDKCGEHTMECICKMNINLEELPSPLQFAYIALTKSAIIFKKMERDKKFFLAFCEEIWNSMEMSDIDYLNETIDSQMEDDIEANLESYFKDKAKKNHD